MCDPVGLVGAGGQTCAEQGSEACVFIGDYNRSLRNRYYFDVVLLDSIPHLLSGPECLSFGSGPNPTNRGDTHRNESAHSKIAPASPAALVAFLYLLIHLN